MHQLPVKRYLKSWLIWQGADEAHKLPIARPSQAVTKKTTYFPGTLRNQHHSLSPLRGPRRRVFRSSPHTNESAPSKGRSFRSQRNVAPLLSRIIARRPGHVSLAHMEMFQQRAGV